MMPCTCKWTQALQRTARSMLDPHKGAASLREGPHETPLRSHCPPANILPPDAQTCATAPIAARCTQCTATSHIPARVREALRDQHPAVTLNRCCAASLSPESMPLVLQASVPSAGCHVLRQTPDSATRALVRPLAKHCHTLAYWQGTQTVDRLPATTNRVCPALKKHSIHALCTGKHFISAPETGGQQLGHGPAAGQPLRTDHKL